MISGRGRGKIRPPRRNLVGHGDSLNFDELWGTLKSALRDIHSKNASKLAFEQLYRAAYKIVLKKKGDLLYEHVKEFEEQWFRSEVMPKILLLITNNLVAIATSGAPGATANERRLTGELFLKGLKKAWEEHNLCMNMATDILMYMDRVYCIDNHKPSIFTTAMGLFRDHVLRSQLVATEFQVLTFDIVNSVILDQIQMEREGDVVDKNLIRSCVYMLEGLYETDDDNENEKLYLTVFEPAFLTASQQFYRQECEKLLRESNASVWLKQTQKRLVEENDRCKTTISRLTEAKITRLVETEMIASHLRDFIALEGSGVKSMITNDRYEDLSLLYQNISRIDQKKEALMTALQARVVDLGTEINQTIQSTDWTNHLAFANETSTEKDKSKGSVLNVAAQQTAAAIKWVDEVLLLKDKFDRMWQTCFSKDLILQSALTNSFTEFINIFPRSSEYVSLFIDSNLKIGAKGRTEAEVDDILDKATTLIRYIRDKDKFEHYYKKHLARRLLHGKSESTEVEQVMIQRMKQEVGSYFTSKLEGMFKDMTLSNELTSGYRTHVQNLGENSTKPIDLGISVLTSNFWPMEVMGGGSKAEDGTVIQCAWPREIKLLQESFTKYYLKERNGRKLSWLGFTGTADLRCTFPGIPGKEGILGRERRHEISVPTYGMVVLLLFNDLAPGEALSLEEIHQQTSISIQELSRLLVTLAVLPKAKVLNKHPPGKVVRPGDSFSFNEAFQSKSVKIKAPTVTGASKVEGDDERKQTESRNDEMRGGVIEAAIVRIMKQRKELPHHNLFSELITQLASRFRPDLNIVKKRVESLIERDYLERVDDAERPTYRYLA